jgi:predicted DCC family thiol-disulfide oxidoreductase YuxK
MMSESIFEVFYDGECPLCRREIAALRRFDRQTRVLFTDIAAPSGVVRASSFGLSYEQLMARVHGRTADGEIVEGVEVFRKLYAAVGLEKLVAWTRLPGIRNALDAAYTVFARQRLRLTGRCTDERCDVAQSS